MAFSSPVYGIVGQGKMARHLQHYFQLLGLAYKQWDRSIQSSPEKVLADCDIVIVAIRDDAIATWVNTHSQLHSKILIHCSGVLTVPNVQGVHPLFSFPDQLYELNVYNKIPFICEKGAHTFKELFPALPNPSYTIESDKKKLYHALCVIMGNLPTLLWQEAIAVCKECLELPPTLFGPFLQQTLLNTLANPETALTGPIQRQDWHTIKDHFEVLPKDNLKEIYSLFLSIFAGKSWQNLHPK